jgi:hypothetical protein
MRSAVAVLLVAGLAGVGACSSSSDYLTSPSSIGGGAATAAKPSGGGGGNGGGNTIDGIPAVATFAGGAISGMVEGTIYSHFILEGVNEVTFDCDSIAPLDGAPPFPGCESAGDTVTVSFDGRLNTMRELPTSDSARQAAFGWKLGKTPYSLAWQGESAVETIYAHAICHEQTDGACTNATYDTEVGTYPSASNTPHQTGARAVLRLRQSIVGLYEVPFSVTVVAVLPGGGD